MDQSAFIDLNSLSEEAKKELENFYEYLVFKYKNKIIKKTNGKNKKDKFFEFVKTHSYNLPLDYKFNREELHER